MPFKTRLSGHELIEGRRPALLRIGGVALIGGAIEAVFLVILTRVALAVSEGRTEVLLARGVEISVLAALGLAAALVIIRFGFAALALVLRARVASAVTADLRRRTAESYFSASWESQQESAGGGLQELMTTYANKATAAINAASQWVLSAANLAALLVLAIVVEPIGAIGFVVLIAVFGSVLRPVRAAITSRARAAREAGMTFAREVHETSRLGLESHVFAVREPIARRLGWQIDHNERLSRRLALLQGAVGPIYTAMAFLVMVVALALMSRLNEADIESFGAVIIIMLRAVTYGMGLQSSAAMWSGSIQSVDGLIERIDRFDASQATPGGEPLDRVGAIEVRDVTFAYGSEPVLRDFSAVIEPDQVVGIIGPSGSGKSTFVHLLLGLYPPDIGQILVDGRPSSGFDRGDWSERVSFVPQEPHLFDGTIAENVRFFRSTISDDDVDLALDQANLRSEVDAMPLGADHGVGPEGSHLSGGQRQRVCLARALAGRPDVLVLDEPTSALDGPSEQLIRSTLVDLRRSMTIVIIAHRMSTLDICDRIMVIEDGSLRAFATPAELHASSDFYQRALAASELR